MEHFGIREICADDSIPYHLLLDADPSRAMIEGYIPDSRIFIAILKDEVIGVYVLQTTDETTAEIRNIAVAEAYQRRGIGKQMLDDAEWRARQWGCRMLTIGTGNSSIGQLYLYQKAGYELTSLKLNYFTDNYPDTFYENEICVKHMVVLTKQL